MKGGKLKKWGGNSSISFIEKYNNDKFINYHKYNISEIGGID